MNKTKAVLTALLISILSPMVYAQEKPEVTLKADLVSKYIWRGLDLGHASVQPTLAVAWKGLSLEAWGSIGITDSKDWNELDLSLAYTTGGLSFGVRDYWSGTSDDRYFYYKNNGTQHEFEGFVSYDFGVASASWQTIFTGFDEKNNSGKRAYSSYFEAIVPFKLATCDWEATIGVVPFATSLYHTSGMAVTSVNLRATKEIRITDSFSVPIFAQIFANPCTEKAYFIFGITLNAL